MAPSSRAGASSPARDKDKEDSAQLSDAALRKKKNADAQAAFRARRANYISTLEETVTNLEQVVLQLQESVRDHEGSQARLQQENESLKQEIMNVKHYCVERDSFWRSTCMQKGIMDGLPPPPAFGGSYSSYSSSSVGHQHHPMSASSSYSEHQGNLSYPVSPSITQPPAYSSMSNLADHPLRPSSASYTQSVDPDQGVSPDGRSLGGNRPLLPKYDSYPPHYVPAAARGADWPQQVAQSSSSGADSSGGHGSGNSPNFVESPINTPDAHYGQRYAADDQKSSPLVTGSGTQYMYPVARSPSTAPSSSSSTHTAAPYYALPPEHSGVVPDDLRRHSIGHGGGEVTLHGGIANISVPGQGHDGVRYRLASSRRESAPDRGMFPALPHFSQSEALAGASGAGSSGDAGAGYAPGRLRSDRGAQGSSRSPSPGPSPISGTLAVIKAQAFGALRRTRGRKKGDDAARMAKEALEARGISLGVSTAGGTKRQRTRYEEDDSS
ncbi:hypothetical protein PENSPDRAFT_12602 [Peniophora sp. CONT]|nr:hypothetical protein PENSPDRAFT_12602 [Peniophora sp. CONT]